MSLITRASQFQNPFASITEPLRREAASHTVVERTAQGEIAGVRFLKEADFLGRRFPKGAALEILPGGEGFFVVFTQAGRFQGVDYPAKSAAQFDAGWRLIEAKDVSKPAGRGPLGTT